MQISTNEKQYYILYSIIMLYVCNTDDNTYTLAFGFQIKFLQTHVLEYQKESSKRFRNNKRKLDRETIYNKLHDLQFVSVVSGLPRNSEVYEWRVWNLFN